MPAPEGFRPPAVDDPMSGPGGGPLLTVTGVTKSFGGIAAVRNVSFRVEPGESVGLVGPNGAGKTTLFNCICGQLRPENGTVELKGTTLGRLPTFRRARLGIGVPTSGWRSSPT